MKHKQLKAVIIFLLSLFFVLFGSHAFAIDLGDDNYITSKRNGDFFSFVPSVQVPTQTTSTAKITANLPTKYDLRNINGKSYVNPPEFQNPWGCCWAFGALSAAESNALLSGQVIAANFSKRALAYYTYQKQGAKNSPVSTYEGATFESDSIYNPLLSFNAGGSYSAPTSQLSTWNSASTSKEIPYQNDEGIIKNEENGVIEYSAEGTWSLPYKNIYDDAFHLLGNNVIKTYSDYTRNWIEEYTEEAKSIMMQDGALMLGFNMAYPSEYFNKSTYSQYISTPTEGNHAISIVGWDDTYPVENFNPENQPPAPGAWICKNNWSTNWGENGYFYLSYYDQSIIEFGSYEVEVGSDNYSYDAINQYDYLGNKDEISASVNKIFIEENYEKISDPSEIRVANIYENQNECMLNAVSAYTYFPNAAVDFKVYLLDDTSTNPEDGRLIQAQTEEVLLAGFNAFDLELPVHLLPGQKYSVVQNIIYKDFGVSENSYQDVPGLPIEFGLSEPIPMEVDMYNFDEIVNAELNYEVNIESGTSFIYGMNDDEPEWQDLSREEAKQELKLPYSDYENITTVPGNAMIKTYTTNLDKPYIPTTEINVNDNIENIFLSTQTGATNSIELKAVLSPVSSNDPITWSLDSDEFVTLSNISGDNTKITALKEGFSVLTVNAGSATTIINVQVSNKPVVCSSFEIETDSPDYYSIIVHDVIPNPAIDETGDIEKVSIFNWSKMGADGVQEDMNAKVAERIPGTNDWQWKDFPVNDNALNNYFIDAEDISINIYGSKDTNSEGNLIAIGSYFWINSQTVGTNYVSYIGYSQNLGFVHPTVSDGETAGTTGRNLNLEGFRISSNVENLDINTRVHVQNLGWMDSVSQGVYAGTMHRNLGIEAIELTMTGDVAQDYSLEYRVHQKNFGWQNWFENGQTAGSTGLNNQIEAIEVKLSPKY